MEIAIDEWIVHFISESHKRRVAFEFLERVLRKCDKLVVLRGGPLDQKIWDMAKSSQNWDIEGRGLAKWFMGTFRSNSMKFSALEESIMEPLSRDLQQDIPNDDVYLVKTAINTTDRLILTTDTRLKEALSGKGTINVRLVDEFLKAYDC